MSKIISLTPNLKANGLEKHNEAFLNSLADELSFNYLSNSFGDNDKSEIKTERIFDRNIDAEKFRKRLEANKKVRNIIVIGAGTSTDAYKGIPNGNQLIEEVKSLYEKTIQNIGFLNEKFKKEERSIKKITNQDKLYFENYLYLLSTFFVTQDNLRKEISEMTGFTQSPVLFNEIIAHLLKHAFVDVVINFNFEETLDHAIEREIGKENYQFVISDGHCVKIEDIVVDGRLKLPVYIKPHGTFSHKSSLKFTNQHYLEIPDDIKNMLESLIGGHRGKEKEVQNVNIICIGFALESVEFNEILNEFLPPHSKIYSLGYFTNLDENWVKKQTEKFKSNYALFLKRAEKVNRFNIFPSLTDSFNDDYLFWHLGNQYFNSTGENKNELVQPLGEIMSILWRKIHHKFRERIHPRSIARHEIISYLFYDPQLGHLLPMAKKVSERRELRIQMREGYEHSTKYFRDRVLVEIAISLLRHNGTVDIAELLHGSVGYYYQKYRYCFEQQSTKDAKIHKGWVKKINSIYDLLNEFNLEGKTPDKGVISTEYHYAKNIFTLDEKEFEEKVQDGALNKLWSNWKNLIIATDKNIKVDERKANEKFIIAFNKIITDKGFDRTLIVLYYLFRSDKLSNRFKLNFLRKFDKLVYTGLEQVSGNFTMLQELYRLFHKSSGKHYFVINDNPHASIHNLFESYNRSKILHTNLALVYEFRHVFEDHFWDIMLSVTEVGNHLKVSEYLDSTFLTKSGTVKHEKIEELRKKHLIMICSYEAVKQLYPEVIDTDYERLIEIHKKNIISDDSGNPLWCEENVTILLMPFNQHNHHVTMFLKAIDSTDSAWHEPHKKIPIFAKDKGCGFIADSSFYIYRRGASNSIDPLYIGTNYKEVDEKYIQQDQIKLLLTFFDYVRKSFLFESTHNINDETEWNKATYLKGQIKNMIKFNPISDNYKFDKYVNKNLLEPLYKQLKST